MRRISGPHGISGTPSAGLWNARIPATTARPREGLHVGESTVRVRDRAEAGTEPGDAHQTISRKSSRTEVVVIAGDSSGREEAVGLSTYVVPRGPQCRSVSKESHCMAVVYC